MMSKEKRRVPKLRFPGFTEDWEQRKLNDFGIATGGISIESEFVDGGTYKVINIGSYSEESVYNDQGLRVNKTDKTKSRILNKYDLTMILNDKTASGNIIGRVLLIDQDNTYVYNQRTERIEVDTKDFLPMFLYHMLNAPEQRKYIVKASQGNTQIYVNWSTISNIDYMIPQLLLEQEKIANLFSLINKDITLHQRKLNNLKLKKKALLQKLFPKNEERYPELRFPGFTDAWEQRKFKDIAFKRGKISEADLPYVEFEDINSGIGTLNKNISQKVGHKKGLLFEAGDVLFGKLRPYLQNWLLCQFAGIAVGDFWVLQPQNVSSAFLYYLIQSEAYQSVANISSGTKMPRSSWPLVSETLFSIPKYKEANMIGEFFLLIDRTITLHQRKLDHLQLQKKALLQQMFV